MKAIDNLKAMQLIPSLVMRLSERGAVSYRGDCAAAFKARLFSAGWRDSALPSNAE